MPIRHSALRRAARLRFELNRPRAAARGSFTPHDDDLHNVRKRLLRYILETHRHRQMLRQRGLDLRIGGEP